MEDEKKYDINVIDSVWASIENMSVGYLQKIYLKKLFSNLIDRTKGVIVFLEYPTSTTIDLSKELNEIQQTARFFNEKKLNNNGLPSSISFSLIYNQHIDFKYIVDFLSLTWELYESSYVFFLTEERDVEDLEDLLIKSKKKKILLLQDYSIKPYICYYKDEIDEHIIYLCNRSSISFDKIVNPNPALYIDSQIKNGILYQIPYSDEIQKGRELIDSILLELKLKGTKENKLFSINDNSAENLLILDVQSKNSIHIQIFIRSKQIYFNVDRISDTESISLDNSNARLLLKEKLIVFLFSRSRVEYRGDVFNTKVCFFNKQGEMLMKLSSDYFRILNLLAKPVIFNYEPICQ